MTVRRLAPLAIMAFACSSAAAVSLGVIGPTYPISEPHFLEQLLARLREKEQSGELARAQREALDRATASVMNPRPVEGLRTVRFPRTFYVDPTFTLDRNITDQQGRVLFPTGTRKNPLEVVSLSRRLLFFDGRDKAQQALARDLIARNRGRIKPILVAGSYIELMRGWKVPLYYDQQGTLVRRLGITSVPAVVSQEGLRLRVDEVAVAP